MDERQTPRPGNNANPQPQAYYDANRGTYVYRQPGEAGRQTQENPGSYGQYNYYGNQPFVAPPYGSGQPQGNPYWQQGYQAPPAYPYNPYPYRQAPYAAPEPKGLGIASLVLGILSLSGLYALVVIPLIGLILGIVQYKRTGDGISLGGIITNAIALAVTVLIILFMVIMFAALESGGAFVSALLPSGL